MAVLPAQTIRQLQPVFPFVERGVAHGRSFGLSPCGYDIRLRDDVMIAPDTGVLALALESFSLPFDIVGVVHDKSTNARLFLFVQNTVIEPGFFGDLMLELTSRSPQHLFLKAGTPIAQVLFHRLEAPTEQPYSGKYQGQRGFTPAILEES